MGNADERRSERSKVLLTAMIENGGSRIPVRVSNLSAHGALVIGKELPPSEERVVFHCNGFATGGWIAWVKDGHAGIQFDEPVEPEKLVQRLPTPRVTIIKDTRELNFRRPGFRGNQLTDEQRKIVEEWTKPESKPTNGENP